MNAVPAANAEIFDVLVVGGGAAGIGVTASLLRRRPGLRIAIIEPADRHFYQPAWTLVGGGAFNIADTARPMLSVIPAGARWLRASASAIDPTRHCVQLDDGQMVRYRRLIVCPGLRLAWEKIAGLEETLGRNGVTSNYRFDLAPYTWKLVSEMKRGKAIFTQPAMPIKCAGAPQKALYLSCDHWLKQRVLDQVDVELNLAGDVLFGVAAFVPSLMKYIERYQASLAFGSNLVSVNGASRIATFDVKDGAGGVVRIEKPFDMLHVVPPQVPPAVVSNSTLADQAGWCEVDHATLAHPRYPDVFALGDACSAPNAKTAAAIRKQIVVVAENLLATLDSKPLPLRYDGYGACPLTVEKGKVVLAEFGYGGKLLPTFPLDPTVPRALAWQLKARFFPWLYWNGPLKGREWLVRSTLPRA